MNIAGFKRQDLLQLFCVGLQVFMILHQSFIMEMYSVVLAVSYGSVPVCMLYLRFVDVDIVVKWFGKFNWMKLDSWFSAFIKVHRLRV